MRMNLSRCASAFVGAAASLFFSAGCANDNPVGTGGAGGGGGATTASSTHASSSSSQSSSSASSSSASSTSSTGTGCNDTGPGEPNDTMANAVMQPGLTDCTGMMGTVDGVLASPTDVDWYQYDGSDTLGLSCSVGAVHPTAQLVGPVGRVCMYFTCTAAAPTCPSGTQTDTFSGIPGCCWMGGAEVTVDLNCNGTDDSSTVLMRVDHPGGTGCEPYTLNYRFHP